jgi:hypothetical protein
LGYPCARREFVELDSGENMRVRQVWKIGSLALGGKSLAWAAVWFVLVQLAVAGFLEWKHPEFYDPRYGCRLRLLRAELSRTAERKLVVVLGTSRAEQGFRPALLSRWQGETGPVLFNLARGGSGPLLHLLTLQRLLADGIRPDGILLEIFPPSLVEDDSGVTIPKTTLRDFPWLSRYPVSWKTYTCFLRDRALLWHGYRDSLLAACAPAWLTPAPDRYAALWDARGGEWRAIGDGATPEERRDLLLDARRRYFRKLQDFHVSAGADRALHDLLGLCQRQGIAVVLFLMPEASAFRAWYPPPTEQRLSAYLATMSKEYAVPLIDAREWIADDDFWDGHHLLRAGATAFTRRFAASALPSLFGSDLMERSAASARTATGPR